jgi:hypothetical protein
MNSCWRKCGAEALFDCEVGADECLRETKHFLITRDFLNSPERFFKHLFVPTDDD